MFHRHIWGTADEMRNWWSIIEAALSRRIFYVSMEDRKSRLRKKVLTLLLLLRSRRRRDRTPSRENCIKNRQHSLSHIRSWSDTMFYRQFGLDRPLFFQILLQQTTITENRRTASCVKHFVTPGVDLYLWTRPSLEPPTTWSRIIRRWCTSVASIWMKNSASRLTRRIRL